LSHSGLAIEAGADVTATVCGSSKSETRCRYRDGCAYFAQIERAKAADIVIVAHNFLFDPLPQALLDNVSAVVAIGSSTVPMPWVLKSSSMKKGFFPDMSESSSAFGQVGAGLGAATPADGPRAPPAPDG
jgi:hypothetical protein